MRDSASGPISRRHEILLDREEVLKAYNRATLFLYNYTMFIKAVLDKLFTKFNFLYDLFIKAFKYNYYISSKNIT